MISRLNTWQKFWVMFAGVFLVSTLVVIATLWPLRDPGVVTDLRAPECQEWRETPAGAAPQDVPAAKGQCQSIRALLVQQHVNLRTEDDYDRYLLRSGLRVGLTCLAVWAGFVAGIYLLGWSSGLLVGAMRKKESPKAI
ncbi:MAG: hypothetical protein ABI567_02800 [Gammaproteobacteria bacterium]